MRTARVIGIGLAALLALTATAAPIPATGLEL